MTWTDYSRPIFPATQMQMQTAARPSRFFVPRNEKACSILQDSYFRITVVTLSFAPAPIRFAFVLEIQHETGNL